MDYGSTMQDEEEYELLYPSAEATERVLSSSEFYAHVMPKNTDTLSEALLAFCGSFPVRAGPQILSSLVLRFTDARFNWETKTLQSFLELTCWLSVSLASYSLTDDWLFALQVGTLVGAVMSVCDEIVLHFVRGLARVIRNQPGGGDVLQRLGFDVPTDGKAPTDGQEVLLFKNLVFGYLGVVAVRALWANFHDVQRFALLTAGTGVAFVVTAEFCCLWLPTRRVGLTLQSRFTRVRANWSAHPQRSLAELLCWILATMYFYHSSQHLVSSLQLGTLVAVAASLASGLEDLPDIVSSDDIPSQRGELEYWRDRAAGDAFMAIASGIVSVEKGVSAVFQSVEREAMNMYENFGE